MAESESETTVTVVDGGRTTKLAGRSGERYQLGALIGKDGMGDVHAAIDAQLGREVAVKRMKSSRPSDHAMARFFREASVQGRLDHPAIVPVHELGVDEAGRPFFAMKRLTGTTLAEHLARGTSRERLLRAFADVCLAIEFAHSRSIVHRNLKPQNIVLGEFGEAYVIDWGVARVLGEPDDPGAAQLDDSEPPLTTPGTVIGTRGYMAPEQARAASDVDGRADVYALGCLLYEILTGERLDPGKGGTRRDSRPSLVAEVAPELDALCVGATQVDRELRIQTARELGERVQRYLEGDRDLATRKELARTHVEAARAAFARVDDEPARRTAMREAGRALALDPAMIEAADLVGRLMLEPPRETPPEVVREMADEDAEMQHHRGRAVLLAHVFYLPVLVIVIAVGAGWLALALAIVILANVGLIVADLRLGWKVPWWVAMVATMAVLVVLARMYSPLLVAPTIAGLAGIMAGVSSLIESRRVAVIVSCALIATIVLPLVGEWIGLLPATVSVAYGMLCNHPPGLAGPPMFIWGSAIIYTISLIVSCVVIGRTMRVGDHGARRQLHLQTWQLRQLVPTAKRSGQLMTTSSPAS